jgi:hypothetical protein
MHLRTNKWTAMGAYSRAKLAVMMWGLDLDRRLREANSPVVTQLTHPGWVSSNLSSISDSRVMAAADKVVKRLADVFGNDIDAGAATSLYCISEPIPPGAYVGIEGRWGFKGGPVMIGRSAVACDYEAAARLVEFAEKETDTSLSV